MFFRNLSIYRLTGPLEIGKIEQALQTRRARPCASQELETTGFIAPIGKGEEAPLLHIANGYLLLAVRIEERILPGRVIRKALDEKVEEIEASQMRTVYKKERDQLKDEIVTTLMPRAFTDSHTIHAAIDPKAGLIYIDTSWRKAETLLSCLRDVLGRLPVRPLNLKTSPTTSFTEWVRTGTIGCGHTLGDRATLADTSEDGGKVVATRQDLGSEEIQNHLAAGKRATKLALDWSDKLTFVIDDKLAITGLNFCDQLVEQAWEEAGDALDDRPAASFIIMMGTFAEWLPQLIEALGGEDLPDTDLDDIEASTKLDDTTLRQAVADLHGFVVLGQGKHATVSVGTTPAGKEAPHD